MSPCDECVCARVHTHPDTPRGQPAEGVQSLLSGNGFQAWHSNHQTWYLAFSPPNPSHWLSLALSLHLRGRVETETHREIQRGGGEGERGQRGGISELLLEIRK